MTSLNGYTAESDRADGQYVAVIHGQIRSAILRGEMAPGDEVSQVRLARHLGVSRTPLREALRMLVYEGLLEGIPGRQLRVAGFSVKDMEQLYVQRVTLEAIGIRITVPRLTDEDVKSMEQLHSSIVSHDEKDGYDAWEGANRALHLAFVAAAGDRTVGLITQLYDHAERYRRLYTMASPGSHQVGDAEHLEIIEAARQRDSDQAARALADHLGHTALGVIELAEPDYRASALRLAINAAGAPLKA